jgi:NADH-quinone oxidoreductase E subunit
MEKHKINMTFEFSEENQEKIREIISHYPQGREKSAVMPLLDLAQRQNNNWVSKDVIEAIAKILKMPEIKVYEVASFYTMYNLKPVGKYLIQFCKTTPCMLRGIDSLMALAQEKLGIKIDETSEDNLFTLKEVECLGACVNAPIVQINDDFYEDLDKENFAQILEDLQAGRSIKLGSQINRQCSAPINVQK